MASYYINNANYEYSLHNGINRREEKQRVQMGQKLRKHLKRRKKKHTCSLNTI